MKLTFISILLAFFAIGCSSTDKKLSENKKQADKKEAMAKTDKKGTKAEAKKSADAKDSVKCQLAKDVRTLEIKDDLKNKSIACEVHYTKSEGSQKIASAKSDSKYCLEVLQKVKSNLETAGFKCGM